jgi:1L-myo-inositol 1-phosphate cytidylyltransferase
MLATNKAVILAAGNGSRLRSVSGSLPKPLVNLNGRPILEHILLSAKEAGIREFVVILGYRGEAIKSCFSDDHRFPITWVENPEYHKANGISLLKAQSVVSEPFLLLMSDHVFEPRTAAALLRQPIKRDEVILAVDEKLDSIFDMDDATKVYRTGDYIIDIGKQIRCYDAVDTGMFLCSPTLFQRLESCKVNDDCSLSDGMRQMARERKFRAFDIGDGWWQDIDSPEALAYARGLFAVDLCPSSFQEVLTSV